MQILGIKLAIAWDWNCVKAVESLWCPWVSRLQEPLQQNQGHNNLTFVLEVYQKV